MPEQVPEKVIAPESSGRFRRDTAEPAYREVHRSAQTRSRTLAIARPCQGEAKSRRPQDRDRHRPATLHSRTPPGDPPQPPVPSPGQLQSMEMTNDNGDDLKSR